MTERAVGSNFVDADSHMDNCFMWIRQIGLSIGIHDCILERATWIVEHCCLKKFPAEVWEASIPSCCAASILVAAKFAEYEPLSRNEVEDCIPAASCRMQVIEAFDIINSVVSQSKNEVEKTLFSELTMIIDIFDMAAHEHVIMKGAFGFRSVTVSVSMVARYMIREILKSSEPLKPAFRFLLSSCSLLVASRLLRMPCTRLQESFREKSKRGRGEKCLKKYILQQFHRILPPGIDVPKEALSMEDILGSPALAIPPTAPGHQMLPKSEEPQSASAENAASLQSLTEQMQEELHRMYQEYLQKRNSAGYGSVSTSAKAHE
eukprot:ANDGO_01070.mRNA.1 hypothetical protein